MARRKQEPPELSLGLWSRPWPVQEAPLQVELGDLSLTVQHLHHEWQLNYHWTRRENNGGFSCEPLQGSPRPEDKVDRIAMEKMSAAVRLLPRLSDRPVVVLPYSALTLPAHNRVTLFVSTPLWLALEFAPGVQRELPAQQLSDTWMGALTGHGELCYGSHTHARLDRELLLKRPFRAITPITIHNKSQGDATLERLSIPAPFLSLYGQEEQLVTEPLTIAMDREKAEGVVHIGSLEGVPRIAGARRRADRGILVSAWENLFA